MSEAPRLVIVGESMRGSAGLRARELDAAVRPTLVVADAYPSFSICGIPYWLSGEVADRRNLAHRTRQDLERAVPTTDTTTKGLRPPSARVRRGSTTRRR